MKNLFFTLSIIALTLQGIAANDPEIWRLTTLADLLKGEAKGVSVKWDGTVIGGPAIKNVLDTGERQAWSVAADSKGNLFVGTGGSGKLFRVDTTGQSKLFATLREVNITAIAINKRDEVFVGSSPDGKVYKIRPDGGHEIFFDPAEKYIWSIAVLPDQSLAVATGTGGRIYRVSAAGADRNRSILIDTDETNITSLAVAADGTLFAGTDPNGLVLGISPKGTAFAVLDSPLREIRDIAIGRDGLFYALAVAESVPNEGDAIKTTPTRTVSASQPESATKSRNDTSGSKSIVYRLSGSGSNEIVWNSGSIAAFSILASENGELLIGTSDRGRIFSVDTDFRTSLTIQTDELHVSRLIKSGDQVIALSSAGGKALSIGSNTGTTGEYLSPILDARNVSKFGRLRWKSAGNVRIEVRSGNTENPDATWSDWMGLGADRKMSPPNARFLQWRAVLAAGSTVSDVSLAFSQLNVAPEVLSVQVLPMNVALAPNPSIQMDPNIELSGMDPALFGLPNIAIPPRRLYQRGAVSLQWTAEDRNGDRLVYDVRVRRYDEKEPKELRSGLTDNFLTVDGLVLADGFYRFEVIARDSPSRTSSDAMTGSLTTAPVIIDNTAPAVNQIGRTEPTDSTATIHFNAKDVGGQINRAEFSVNGGSWSSVIADDGVNDDEEERFTVTIKTPKPGEYSVVFRSYDLSGNSGSVRVIMNK